jgi:putative endonuclease
MKTSDWFLYIIRNAKNQFYTGITTDLDRRFKEHAGELKGGAKFFRSSPAMEVVFFQKFANRSEASKNEALVKKMKRSEKLKLIEKGMI